MAVALIDDQKRVDVSAETFDRSDGSLAAAIIDD
jgi:hypothetical protein